MSSHPGFLTNLPDKKCPEFNGGFLNLARNMATAIKNKCLSCASQNSCRRCSLYHYKNSSKLLAEMNMEDDHVLS